MSESNIKRNSPLFTIMIPTYNQEEYIIEAVNSALMQDYKNIEVIVSDDCSQDSTQALVSEIDNPKLIYCRSKTNMGRVKNYHHTAHDLSHGQWAVNLDRDDYFTVDWFVSEAMKTISQLQSQKIVAYCYNHFNIDKIAKIIPSQQIDDNRILVSGKDYFLNYAKIGAFFHSAFLFRRDIGVKLNLYTLPYQACDFHSLIRLMLLGNVILDRRPISYWRTYGDNTTFKEVDVKLQQMAKTLDAIEDFAKEYCTSSELKKWRKSMNTFSTKDYISTYAYLRKDFRAYWLLLSHPWIFEKWYIRSWYYLLFK